MDLSVLQSTVVAAFLRRWQPALIVAITLLAAFLRFYRLPDMPPGLFSDEAWSGLMARQVLHTGQLQVFFASNQGVEPLVVYLAVPIVAIFGDPIWQLRIPEAIIGTLTIPALWWMCRELFGRRSARAERAPSEDEYVTGSVVGLGAALALASLFWHINLSRIGLEPILVPLTLCLTIATLARALDSGRGRDYALAGVVLAANLYTYKAGYAVPALAALFVAYTALTERGFLRREWRHLAVWVGVAALVAAPMAIYMAAHPDEFFTRFNSVTAGSPASASINLGDNAVRTLKMFFISGDADQRYNIPGRPALDPLMAILFLGGLGISLSNLRDPRRALPALWLVVMSLPTAFSDFAPHWGRAIGVTPVLAVLCALGAAGAWSLSARIGRRWAAPLTLAGLGLMAILSGVGSTTAYFGTFNREPFLFYSFDEGTLKLAQEANAVPAGQRAYVVIDTPDSYTLQYVIQRPYATYDGRDGTVYPPPGQAATEVVIAPHTRSMVKAMQAARPDSRIVWQLNNRDQVLYARALSLPASDHPAASPSHAVEAELGGAIRLLGYDVDRAQVRPGDTLTLTIYWQPLRAVSQDYTVFSHLVAGQGLLAGADGPPINGSYPTTAWAAGETILDSHIITIPADAPSGSYHLQVGMYLLDYKDALTLTPAVDPGGNPIPHNSVELGTVQVGPAR